jgi:hypothetical protein
LAVNEGAGAMAAWIAMVEEPDPDRKQQMENDLLAYCKLDMFAMVEIYRFLDGLVN